MKKLFLLCAFFLALESHAQIGKYLQADEIKFNATSAPVAPDKSIRFDSGCGCFKYKEGGTDKTFVSLTSLSANVPLSYNTGTGAFSIQQATTSQHGYLSNTDWNTFNGKADLSYVDAHLLGLTVTNSPSSGFAPVYNGTNLTWQVISSSLGSASDANISSPSNLQFLRYHTSDSKWHNDSFVSGTDYAPPTSGSSILYGNGSGGTSNASLGSTFSFSSGNLQTIALTGDVTSSANSFTTTVAKINGNTVPSNAFGSLFNNGSGTLTWFNPNFKTPEQFGAVGDDSTPDDTAWQNAINDGASIRAKSGTTYLISTGLTHGDRVDIDGQGATLHTTSNIFILTGNGKEGNVRNLNFKGNSSGAGQGGYQVVGNSGFTLNYTANKLSNLRFNDLNFAGVYGKNVLGVTGSTHIGSMIGVNMHFDHCGTAIYLDDRSEYNTFTNIVIENSVNQGIYDFAGNSGFTNISVNDGTWAFKLGTGGNDGHGYVDGFRFNHNSTGAISSLNLVAGFTFSNGFIYVSGTSTFTNSAGIKLTNVNISQSHFTVSNSPLVFNGCTFVSTPTITVSAGQNPGGANNIFLNGVIPANFDVGLVQTVTAGANNQSASHNGGTYTARATASDKLVGTLIDYTLVSAAATQTLATAYINGSFTDSNSATKLLLEIANAGTDRLTIDNNGVITSTATAKSSSFASNFTASTNNDFANSFNGAIVGDGTASDNAIGFKVIYSMTQGANSQNFIPFLVDPASFANGGFTTGIMFSAINTNLAVGKKTMNGNTRFEVQGTGTTSSTTTQRWQNSTPTTTVTFLDDGTVAQAYVGTASSARTNFSTSNGSFIASSGSNSSTGVASGVTLNTTNTYSGGNYSAFYSNVSPTSTIGLTQKIFDATGGGMTNNSSAASSSYYGVYATPVFNLTGSATGGVSYAFYYSPTRTSVSGLTEYAFAASSGNSGFGTLTPIATVDNNGSSAEGITTSSAASLTIDKTATVWVFTGTTSTWTMPAVAGNTKMRYLLYNRGSGNLTVQRAGSDNLYSAGATATSITIAAGSSNAVFNDGTYWLVR